MVWIIELLTVRNAFVIYLDAHSMFQLHCVRGFSFRSHLVSLRSRWANAIIGVQYCLNGHRFGI